jgi:hypothetical protein
VTETHVVAVDLDGTLTFTDTLHESVLWLARNRPLLLLLIPAWLFHGVAHLKWKIAKHSELDVSTLPYNYSLIDWLRVEKDKGSRIVLCTAANQKIARAVVEKFDFFEEYIVSRLSLPNVVLRKPQVPRDCAWI